LLPSFLPARSRFSLHDAKVLNISFGKRTPRFVLRVRLEGTANHPGEILELSYRRVGGPKGGVTIRKHPPSDKGTSDSIWVLHNEFDVDEERAFFTHSLLLTDGHELEVRFHALHIQSLEEVVSPLELVEEKRTWPLVGA
jgi:hypothetical protein